MLQDSEDKQRFLGHKIRRNKERDLRVQKELASMGWHTITIWECELKRPTGEKRHFAHWLLRSTEYFCKTEP